MRNTFGRGDTNREYGGHYFAGAEGFGRGGLCLG